METSFRNLSPVEIWGSLGSALVLPSSVSGERQAGSIWAPPGHRACDPQPQRHFPGFIAIVCLSSAERLGSNFLIDMWIFHLYFHVLFIAFHMTVTSKRSGGQGKQMLERMFSPSQSEQERGVHSLKQRDHLPLCSRQKEEKIRLSLKQS